MLMRFVMDFLGLYHCLLFKHQLISLLVHDAQNHERENHRRNTNNHHGSSDGNERGQHHYSNSHDCVHAIGKVGRLRPR